ncbi:hypothetical protein CTEN210_09437 [Chaetoceros tenuissimus]|uniref:PA domain-containing protein n=1 Tax=Chaetoceros tenuissimus TaxID=426638 RepID=A0AAD3CVF6_9STRA|nr:hypothetical protein CTEN210_09437 [Chaetoceros tenuissimus]
MKRCRRISILLFLLQVQVLVQKCNGLKFPDTVIEILQPQLSTTSTQMIYAAQSAIGDAKLHFGRPSNSQNKAMRLILAPESNPYMCDLQLHSSMSAEETNTSFTDYGGSYFDNAIALIPRGKCSFEKKIFLAQDLGAKHVVIYDTLASRYQGSNSASEIEYDCNNGGALIPESELYITSKTNGWEYDTRNDNLLSGTKQEGNLCAIYNDLDAESPDDLFENKCESKKCVTTALREERTSNTTTISMIEACCAWDLFHRMGEDKQVNYEVQISSSFVNIAEGEKLLEALIENQFLEGIIYLRWYPVVNLSKILVIFIAVGTICMTSWFSSKIFRSVRHQLETAPLELPEEEEALPVDEVRAANARDDDRESNDNNVDGNVGDGIDGDEIVNESGHQDVDRLEMNSAHNESNHDRIQDEAPVREENDIGRFDIDMEDNDNDRDHDHDDQNQNQNQNDGAVRFLWRRRRHAISISLRRLVFCMIMFGLVFVLLERLAEIMVICYGLLGAMLMSYTIVYPTLRFFVDRIPPLQGLRKSICGTPLGCSFDYIDLVSISFSLITCGVWLFFLFAKHLSQWHPFFWIVQNAINASMCITLFCILRLASIKIPMFFYSIGFVYNLAMLIYDYLAKYSPSYYDGQDRTQDYLYCEKYPDDYYHSSCGHSAMPIIFYIPRINDYRGGRDAIGLFQVLLPCLLSGFMARYDASKHIARAVSVRERAGRRNIRDVKTLFPMQKPLLKRTFAGYNYQIVLGYAVSLFLDVLLEAMGDYDFPVMLFIIVLCLGPVLIKAVKKEEMSSLWGGPRRIRFADRISYLVMQRGAVGSIGIRDDEGDDLGTIETRSIISADSDMSSSNGEEISQLR